MHMVDKKQDMTGFRAFWAINEAENRIREYLHLLTTLLDGSESDLELWKDIATCERVMMSMSKIGSDVLYATPTGKAIRERQEINARG